MMRSPFRAKHQRWHYLSRICQVNIDDVNKTSQSNILEINDNISYCICGFIIDIIMCNDLCGNLLIIDK